ncbi:hypothetical protein [Caulobacter sp. 17J65-9]|uniref:hypothetical protein n=1 Tax=Caulobacter sp. 17J65-9 TaxID=2709382 RepID=UPI0013C8E933|nr:hypothetical protein [Caulobacter sp. 17J65-9]NEX93824.1 hypothetical protein [Caulobacter sp. 17J65-9]
MSASHLTVLSPPEVAGVPVVVPAVPALSVPLPPAPEPIIEAAGLAAPMPVAPTPTGETLTARVKRLQAEAKALACEQIGALEQKLIEVAQLAEEIADGGDAYPVGAREIARRLAEEAPQKAQTLHAIAHRA